MNVPLITEIAQLALSLVQSQEIGDLQEGATVASTLLQIAQKGAQAHSQYTGEPLDPGLIQPEVPVCLFLFQLWIVRFVATLEVANFLDYQRTHYQTLTENVW
jgi:hypothetical protein